MTSVFIDGQAGTTGLQIRGRLTERDDIELLTLDDAERKDPAARAERTILIAVPHAYTDPGNEW